MNDSLRIRLIRLLPVLGLVMGGIGLLQAGTSERRYLATIDDSRWYLTDNTATLCRMEHAIPGFGSAVFLRESGRPLRLELHGRQRFDKGVNVELRAETTAWNEHQKRRVLGRFETDGKRGLFEISSDVAERVYYELIQGYQPGFLFYTDHPFIASLATIRFSQEEKLFAKCVAGLYQYNFNDIRVSSIYFDPDEEFASLAEEERAFTRMLDFLEVDDSIREIVVTGHTDKTGKACYNEGLSQRRAWYVYDVLIGLGIDAEKLRIEQAANSRSGKRRVTVELRR